MVMLETERAGFETVTPPTIGLPGAATTETYGNTIHKYKIYLGIYLLNLFYYIR